MSPFLPYPMKEPRMSQLAGNVTPADVLACPMATNDADADTIRDYLVRLLLVVWQDGALKRPFGNSGWERDLELALVSAGFVDGDVDEDGALDRVDSARADQLVMEAIAELGDPAPAVPAVPAVPVVVRAEDVCAICERPVPVGWAALPSAAHAEDCPLHRPL